MGCKLQDTCFQTQKEEKSLISDQKKRGNKCAILTLLIQGKNDYKEELAGKTEIV